MNRTKACATKGAAFVDYGIPDGTDLIHRTYYALRDGDGEFEPSPASFDRLTATFEVAFVRAADLPLVPEPVEAAIADAGATTADAFLDRSAADLRYDLLPAFYGAVAEAYCQRRPLYPDGGVGLRFDGDDGDDGGVPVDAPR